MKFTMTATSHALIGTVIAAKIGNPALGIPLAIASHVIADSIPHWDTATNGKGTTKMFYDTLADVLIGFVSSYLLIYILFPSTNLQYAFLLIIMSQLFDWLTMPYYFFGVERPFFKSIYKFQKLFDKKLNKPWGVVTQVATVLAIITLGYFFK
jgi:hypothetical protein